MARRAMNALQLALGSVGSGIQGYTQARTQREAQEAEQERLRKAEARQMAMDLANLQAQGYERVDDVQRKQQAAIGAAGSLIGSALDAASGGPVRSLPSMADQKALAQGYATAKPERTLEYGGQQLALRETPTERQERLATAQQMKSRRDAESAAEAARKATEAERARIAKLGEDALKAGRNSPAAAQLALENPQAFKAIFEDPNAITPYQREQLALQRERMAYDKTRAAEQDKKAMERIPVSDKRSMNELEATLKELDKALAAVDANPKAFGLKTIMPNVALGRTSGVKQRADVTGAIVKLRRTEFGTSMSKQEKESGESLFPAGGDSADTVRDKLNSLKEKALIDLNAKRSFYGMPEIAPRPALASFKR